jgi:Arc/MetJ family transcription regulator
MIAAMSEGPAAAPLDDRMLRAVAHPLRFQILVVFDEAVASPKQVAERLGEPLGRVAYHVQRLEALGAIELVSTRPRRGATEHFYRALTRPWFDDATWERLPLATRRTLFGDALRRIAEDIGRGVASGGFDLLRAYVGRMRLELDDEGMAEVSRILDAAAREIGDAEAAAKARLDGAAGNPTEIVLLHFGR